MTQNPAPGGVPTTLPWRRLPAATWYTCGPSAANLARCCGTLHPSS